MKKLIVTATVSALLLSVGSAQALTETQTFTQSLTLTDWNNNFSVNQFNSSLGTLTGVDFSFSGASSISATLTNTGSSTAKNVKFTGISLLDANVGAYSSEIDASLSKYSMSNIAAGNTGNTGTQTTTAATDNQTQTSGLSSWIGTGTISGNWSTTTGFSLLGTNTSNVIANIHNYSDAVLSITYEYTAAPIIDAVPEADSYTMMLSGLALLGFMIRRKKSA